MLVDEVDVDVVDEVVLMLMLCGLNGEHRKLVSSSYVEGRSVLAGGTKVNGGQVLSTSV